MQLSLIVGRILTRTGPEGATTFEYYVDGSCSNNSPVKITGFNGVIKEYTYDTYKRPATEKVTIDGVAFTTSFTYNNYNALTKIVYPSGVEENRVYDVTGGLLTVTGGNAGSPVTLFTASDINGFGQYTGYTLGNGKTAQHTYHYGTPTRYYTAGVQDLNFTWDYTKGNLLTRQDAIKIITEDFTFDNLNRLTTSTVNGTQQFSITYDGDASSSMGNIITKTDAGNYVYKTDKIHAVAYITNPAGAQTPPANISTIEQQITYTPFLKTATVTEAPYGLEFTYGPDYQRVKTILKNNGVLQETRLFLGSYEKQIIAGGATREIHYIGGGNGLCAILVKEAGVVTPYYIYSDHLGSILTVTDAAGTIIGEQNFDAWGRKRNPANWQYANVPATPTWLFRGYTGHEHVPEFSLINMNGRIYDPVQGRMLSPDNYVATPLGTQGYNRYGYANNNPLSYTDPDGNIAWFVPIIIGAVAGAYTGASIYSGTAEFWNWKKGWGKAAIIGGIAGAGAGGMVSWAVGATGAVTGGTSVGWHMASNALITANVNMTSKLLQGQNIDAIWRSGLIGFASGAIGAYAHSKLPLDNIQEKFDFLPTEGFLPDNFIQNSFGQIISGTLNGAVDRLVNSSEQGWRLGLHTFLGTFEGMIGGLTVSSLGQEFPGLKTAISSGISSVPGLGLRIARTYLTAYGGFTISNIADKTIMSSASGLSRIATMGGVLGGGVLLANFSIKDWLKKIDYSDPIWGK